LRGVEERGGRGGGDDSSSSASLNNSQEVRRHARTPSKRSSKLTHPLHGRWILSSSCSSASLIATRTLHCRQLVPQICLFPLELHSSQRNYSRRLRIYQASSASTSSKRSGCGRS
jgi:hypothetical protein